jgi:predicted metal-binding membrane protein
MLSWAYMVYLAWDMKDMDMGSGMSMRAGDVVMTHVMSWSVVDFVMTFLMWVVMMVAMMVPAAGPMVLIFANVNRKRQEQQRPFVPTMVFLSGYLVVWWGFALLATLIQWGLHQASLLSSMMGNITPVLGGTLLIAAGVFQWTPFKYACLKHCRTPIGFMMAHWQEGRRGALGMGMHHGVFCLGCCWFLMGLMFVAGVMNLVWMAGIAAYILLEKVVPQSAWSNVVTWGAGLGMVGWGTWMILGVLV